MVAGIQYVIEPSIAYLDNEIFEHYGVEIPDASWTWDELIEIARKCTGTDPVTGKQTYGVQLCYTDTQNIFKTIINWQWHIMWCQLRMEKRLQNQP